LCQSFPVLKDQNELVDFFYIDDAVISKKKLENEEESSDLYLTLDSPAYVHSRLALANYMVDKLKTEIPGWNYVLQQKEIVYLSLD
jgi:hypothetical protein